MATPQAFIADQQETAKGPTTPPDKMFPATVTTAPHSPSEFGKSESLLYFISL
jgi:hypothetical protein